MRIGLAGAGRIGSLPCLDRRRRRRPCEEVLVTDAHPEAAERLAAERGYRAVANLEDLLAEVDGLVITASTASHAAILRAAVAAGVPTFCEKPVAFTVEETCEIVVLGRGGRRAGAGGLPAALRRRLPRRARRRARRRAGLRALAAGEHPRPVAAARRSTCRRSGGLFRDCSVHDVDIIRFVTGREVRSVMATGANKGEPFFTEAGDVDTAAAVLTLDDDTLVSLSATRYNGAGHDVRMEVLGSAGAVGVGYDHSLALRSVEADVDYPRGPQHWSYMERFLPAYRAELGRFTRMVAGADPSPCTVVDALAAFRVTEACELSRAECSDGRDVRDPGRRPHRPCRGGSRMTTHETYDLVAMGRTGVDIYPLDHGVGLEDVRTFEKFLGGSATNVAVAAARHGRRRALVTRTGDDPFGRYVRREAARLGVDARFIAARSRARRRRSPSARSSRPTTSRCTSTATRPPPTCSSPTETCRSRRSAPPGSSGPPSPACPRSRRRGTHHAAWAARGRRRHTVLDLDYRPMFWADPAEASDRGRPALEHVTVAVGNREECEVAVGETDPQRAADALLERGLELAVVKQGPKGVLAATADERVEVPPFPVEVVNGLGAGDAFGGALVHGLLAGWDLRRMLRVRQRRRGHRRLPARVLAPRCRRPPRSRPALADRREAGPTPTTPTASTTSTSPRSAPASRGRIADGLAQPRAAPAARRGRPAAARRRRPPRPRRARRARATRWRWPAARDLLDRLATALVPPGRRRRARHPRHPRRPAADGRARGQGRHRLDEPRRPAGRRLRARRPVHRLHRRGDRRTAASTAARC